MTQPDPRDARPEMPMIERRRIEAQVLGQVFAAMQARLGTETAREILREAVSRAAIAQGAAMASAFEGGPTLADFVAIQRLWTAGGALEVAPREVTDEVFRFDVTRCGYAEMYRAMGLHEIGDILSCTRDGDFCIGFNPAIELTRTQTIMQGASHCDFCYRMTAEAAEA